MELGEIKSSLESLQGRLEKLYLALNIQKELAEIEILEKKLGASDIWDTPDIATQINKDLNSKKALFAKWNELNIKIMDSNEVLELANEDLEIKQELEQNLKTIETKLRQLELKKMLNGVYDKHGAILSVTSGAGGTDAQDWAVMLFRMYKRWLDSKNYQYTLVDYQAGEEAGIKSATLVIEEADLYGYLKAEIGVHRLVRISPFDSNARRHTAFAAIGVIPHFGDEIDIDIKDSDLRIDTFRASGAGGQHVNTTDSAVRITHIPSGVVVQCQNERSQHKNKATALKILKSKLYEIEDEKRRKRDQNLTKDKKKIEWGGQVRSYVLHPYRMVKDHRTGHESGNVERILDGDIDSFIEVFLMSE